MNDKEWKYFSERIASHTGKNQQKKIRIGPQEVQLNEYQIKKQVQFELRRKKIVLHLYQKFFVVNTAIANTMCRFYTVEQISFFFVKQNQAK